MRLLPALLLPWLGIVALLAPAGAQSRPLALDRSMPRKAGLGKSVILSDLPRRGPAWAAVKKLAAHRHAKVFGIKQGGLSAAARRLRDIGPEYVTLVVAPTTVDMNFHLEMLELCRGLDPDPMPDFHFGYLAARDAADLSAWVDRILARESNETAGTEARVWPLTPPTERFAAIDYLLHFGHGNPWCVVGGLTGEQVGALELPRHPVVFSGACFTGVLSRSYHECARQRIYLAPTEVAPEKLLSLNWIHAGASAYVAALEGDRGEMVLAEWDRFRERACPLGDVVGYSYRLAFISLPEDFTGFPRYVPGKRKNMSFYRVMLRGQVSRILLSDPAFRPLREPLEAPFTRVETRLDPEAKTFTVTVEVARVAQGLFIDCFHMRKDGGFGRRITVRIEQPEELPASPGEPTVSLRKGGKEIPVARCQVRPELWGGVRYLNLQAESLDPRLGTPGSSARFVFPLGR